MSKKAVARDMDDVKIADRAERPRITDMVEVLPRPDGKAITVRPFGGVVTAGVHWVRTKKQDGSFTSFPIPCAAFDAETGQREGGDGAAHCPFCYAQKMWRAAHAAEITASKEKGKDNDALRLIDFSVTYYMNVIVRALQKRQPEDDGRTRAEAKTGFKDKGSDSVTPVRVLEMTGANYKGIAGLKAFNLYDGDDGEVAYNVSHPKFGADVLLKYDATVKSKQLRWTYQKGDPKPLTKTEKGFLTWDIASAVPCIEKEDADAEFISWATRFGLDTEFWPPELQPAGKKVGKGKKKLQDDEDDADLYDDGDEPAPKAKAKSSRRADPDDDDFDDGDEDDGDDEPAPKAKAKTAAKPAPKRKPVEDDEDDFDDGDEDDGNEDDELAPRKSAPKAKAKPAAKSSRRADPDDDDDFDDEGDDEGDDEPAPKAKSKSAPKAKTKPARRADPDDEDDFDEGDDGDDEPAPRKPTSRAKPAAKPARRADPDEDDFDEGDDGDDDEPAPRKPAAKKPARR